ncbi:MAG: CRISPR-associated endonuclease Cas2 [Bacilli bacterium]
MRIIVMFDLPTITHKEKQEYSTFRRFLLGNGYIMVQYSVYSRFCRNNTDVNKHIKRLIDNKPKYGNVRVLQVTEKQYENMVFLIGEFNFHEKTINTNPMIIIE